MQSNVKAFGKHLAQLNYFIFILTISNTDWQSWSVNNPNNVYPNITQVIYTYVVYIILPTCPLKPQSNNLHAHHAVSVWLPAKMKEDLATSSLGGDPRKHCGE